MSAVCIDDNSITEFERAAAEGCAEFRLVSLIGDSPSYLDYIEYCLQVVEGRMRQDGHLPKHIVRLNYVKRLALRPQLRARQRTLHRLGHSSLATQHDQAVKAKLMVIAHPTAAPPQFA